MPWKDNEILLGPYSLRPEAWVIATLNVENVYIESEGTVGEKGQLSELIREASQPW